MRFTVARELEDIVSFVLVSEFNSFDENDVVGEASNGCHGEEVRCTVARELEDITSCVLVSEFNLISRECIFEDIASLEVPVIYTVSEEVVLLCSGVCCRLLVVLLAIYGGLASWLKDTAKEKSKQYLIPPIYL